MTRKRRVKPHDVTVTEVAMMLKCTYQRARDLMTRGAFGDTTYDAAARRLTVKRAAVDAFQRSQNRS